ncbi:hypothetical protein ACP4OV_022124 [Aristida adscensionis]
MAKMLGISASAPRSSAFMIMAVLLHVLVSSSLASSAGTGHLVGEAQGARKLLAAGIRYVPSPPPPTGGTPIMAQPSYTTPPPPPPPPPAQPLN